MTPQAPLAVLLSPRPAVVAAARRAGARTLVLAPDLSAPDMRESAAAADASLTVEWRDHPRLMMAVGHLADLPARAAVLGFAERSALAAARANEALRFPGNPHAAVAYLTDKAALRGKVNQLTGAPVRFERCDRAAHLVPVAERVGFPCVAKPRTGSGGQDVHLLRDAADAALLAAELAPEPALIVEEFLDGPEYSAEALSVAGRHTVLAVTRKHPPSPDGTHAGGYDLPAALDPAAEEDIHRLVTATLTAAGQRSGLSQTEVVRTADGPRLIESHAHPGDPCVAALVRAATGTDLYAVAIAAALGLPAPPPARTDTAARGRCAGVRFPLLPPGLLTAVHGVAEARALPGITEVEITVPEGSHVPETTSRVAGHGRVAAVADTAYELEALLRKAVDTLSPAVAPPPAAPGRAAHPSAPGSGPDPGPAAVKEEEHTAA
ncbi:ATP-grasp domain-containing protein [Streptomyces sp. RFCAC02]|uniref:ATP-grasp domain-containing protein n=1 Tax=Streptomyces sp. RFCAC02 TaxID=2499143 RepID=UPI00102004C9|nr:ATP-grasp domain-containing protein [Streptomyces sp. RFCAC02]